MPNPNYDPAAAHDPVQEYYYGASPMARYLRRYKTVFVDAAHGKVASVKIRELRKPTSMRSLRGIADPDF